MKTNYIPVTLKLAISFGLITILLLSVSIFGIIEFKKESQLVKKVLSQAHTISNTIKNIDIDILNIHLLMYSMIENNNTETTGKISKKIDEYDDNIRRNFQLLFHQYQGPKKNVQKVFDIYSKSYAKRSEFINSIKTQEFQKATKILISEEINYIQDIHKEVLVLTDFSNQEIQLFLSNAEKQENEIIIMLSTALFISLILSIIIATAMIKIIIRPLRHITAITKQIENGDLVILNDNDLSTCCSRNDEIGLFFASFHRLINSLLLPYKDIIKSNRPLVEKTDEVRRLLQSFDKYIIASKTDTAGKIIYVSKAFQNISGYTEKELLGHSHNMTGHPDMSKEVFIDLWKTIKSGKTWTGQIKNKTKDGSFFWINTHISPDIDSNGNIVGYNAINENITAIKAYEELSNNLENRIFEEVKKNREQTANILQQSRLAQMGEMINMIAHQWRQPLTSISAISGALSIDVIMDNYDEKYFQERLDSIAEISQHLSGTIDDFRNFFKEDRKETEISLNKLINDCMNIIEPILTSNNIEVFIDTNNTILVKSYINELKQVILSVIKNAKDALLGSEIKDAKIWINGHKDESNIFISIEDNAGGVPVEIIEKVFDPYFSTKKEKDGTGLGLYMSKTIIEEHCRGRLTLINTKNGALFTIELPIQQHKAVS